LKLTFEDIIPAISLSLKKPTSTNIVLNGSIKESNYFTFPGFIKRLRFPSWERSVTLSYNQTSNKHHYFLLFYKTAYLD